MTYNSLPLFSEYVAKAADSRTRGWRIALGFFLIVLFHIIFTVALFLFSPLIVQRLCLLAGCAQPVLDYWEALDTLFTTPFGLAVVLSSIGSMWLAVWFVVRVLHRRQFASIIGSSGRFLWHDFANSFAIWFAVGAVSSVIFFAIDDTAVRSETALSHWVVAFFPLTFFILLQSSAEELVFRGYLQQSLAYRFRHWSVWALLPTILFTLPHWQAEAQPWMNTAYLVSVAVFSLSMTVLVCLTGNLGAVFGAHFANNVVAVLLFSSDLSYTSAALFVSLPFQDPSWSPTDAAIITLCMIVLTVIPLGLSLHSRSPFRLRSISPRHIQGGGLTGFSWRSHR